MDRLMLFPSACREDPAVARWFDDRPGELGALARHWFGVMRGCGDDVRELLHDGCPVACVEEAAFGYVNVFRAHVNVGLFRGAGLDDPQRLLQGTGRRMRHVKLRPGALPDQATLAALIHAACADIRRCLGP